jgi:hypothetical protein
MRPLARRLGQVGGQCRTSYRGVRCDAACRACVLDAPTLRAVIAWRMKDLRLSMVGAVCAIVAVAGFVVGIVLSVSSGVQVLIPEAGATGLFAGAWIAIFAGLVGLIALVGFYDVLKEAGPVMIIAPVAGAVGRPSSPSRMSSPSRWPTSSSRVMSTRTKLPGHLSP